MTKEEVRVFHLAANYALKKKYPYQLKDCKPGACAGVYQLTFEADKGQIRHVTFFKDQFDDVVVKNELGEAIIKNIDDALQ